MTSPSPHQEHTLEADAEDFLALWQEQFSLLFIQNPDVISLVVETLIAFSLSSKEREENLETTADKVA